MFHEFDGLDATEKAGIGTELTRGPSTSLTKLSLADVHASLERAADVLSTLKGSQARGRQRR